MNAFDALSRALGSMEAAIRAATRFETVGLVLPRPDGRYWFELRTPNAVAVNFLSAEQVLPILRLPCGGPQQLAPLAPHFDSKRAACVDRSGRAASTGHAPHPERRCKHAAPPLVLTGRSVPVYLHDINLGAASPSILVVGGCAAS